MKKLLLFVLPFYIYAETSFITPFEYASQLYKNPRGIGCHHCHGNRGEGKVVATYMNKKGEKKEFGGPPINNLKFDRFYKELNRRKTGMPRYFLTTKEIKALYLYLRESRKKNDK